MEGERQMVESKYKIGDRVRVIDYRRMHKGLIGRVRQVNGDHSVIVDFEEKGNGSGGFADYELELVPRNLSE